jgi:2-oxoglutarate dehydrogenase E1 component
MVLQAVINQFIKAGQTKWGQVRGITLFLLLDYEGQGPKLVSLFGKLLTAMLNRIYKSVLWTSAQVYHLLRRQAFQLPQNFAPSPCL